MKAEDVAAEFERLAADCTMPSFAERRLVKARAIRALIAENAALRAAGAEALNVMIGCVAPMGGCDDRRDYDNAIDGLKRALGYKP
jgi:hypothetical protein